MLPGGSHVVPLRTGPSRSGHGAVARPRPGWAKGVACAIRTTPARPSVRIPRCIRFSRLLRARFRFLLCAAVGGRSWTADRRRTTPCQDAFQRVGLALVDCQPVLAPDLEDRLREPARVALRHPLGRVVVALLVAIELGGCQRQVVEIGGEAVAGRRVRPAQAAVVGLRPRDSAVFIGFSEVQT